MSEYDNHWLWRIIENNRAAAERAAPEGYQAVVEAHLVYGEAPIIVSQVETRRDQPWVLLHSYGPERDPQKAHPEDRLVFVHEGQIARAAVRFVKVGRYPPGFRVSELGDNVAS